MKASRFIIFTTFVVALICTLPLRADHDTSFGVVDAIDGTIPPGGGTVGGTVANGADTGWIVFSATAGDMVTVQFGGGFDLGVAVIFREVTNGIVEVGDAANVSDFNGSHLGDGDDLVVETGFYGGGCFGYEFQCFGPTNMVTFTASGTGEYAIGFQAANQSDGLIGTGEFEATVTGITAPPVAPAGAFAQPLGVITCLSAAVPRWSAPRALLSWLATSCFLASTRRRPREGRCSPS